MTAAAEAVVDARAALALDDQAGRLQLRVRTLRFASARVVSAVPGVGRAAQLVVADGRVA